MEVIFVICMLLTRNFGYSSRREKKASLSRSERLRTRVLCQYVVMACQDRHSEDWYVGAITNEEAREITIPLTFLGDGEWMATIYADAPDADWQTNPYATTIETRQVSATDEKNPPRYWRWIFDSLC